MAVLWMLPAAIWAAEAQKPPQLKPGAPIDYGKLAFYPERWQQHKLSTQLVPWEGRQVVLLTTRDDQPVIYAAAMLKLRRDCGGDAWVKRFFAELARCPEIKPDTPPSALRQSYSWLVAASCAAKRDLSGVFVDRWRLPLSQKTRKALAAVDWKKAETADVLRKVPATFTQR